jgi:hypothetical protein
VPVPRQRRFSGVLEVSISLFSDGAVFFFLLFYINLIKAKTDIWIIV